VLGEAPIAGVQFTSECMATSRHTLVDVKIADVVVYALTAEQVAAIIQ